MRNVLMTVIFFWFLPVMLLSQNQEALFQKANDAFRSGKYKSAISDYEALLDRGFITADLHYNLGNAYFRNKKLGKAILHYEKALLLSPGDEDMRHNLQLARNKVNTDLTQLPDFILLEWWRKMSTLLPPNIYGGIAIGLWWFGFGALSFWLFGSTRKKRKWSFLIGIVLLILSALPSALAFSRQTQQKNSKTAIIIKGNASFRSAPDDAGNEIMKLPEGLKISIEDQLGDYSKVRLPDGEDGWLDNEAFEDI